MNEPFTVVYRGLTSEERSSITLDPKAVWFGWCHAPHERDEARAALAAQPGSVGEPTDADWADFGAWAERDKGAMGMLEKLIDVWDDGQLPHEHRCYVDGAWSELIAEARSLLAAAPTEAKPAQQDAVDAIDWAEDARMWGNALNSAGWEFDSAYRRHIGENAPDKLFNFCKPIIRDVILKYAERVAAISAKKGQP